MQWKKIIKNITGDSPSLYRRIAEETLGASPSRATIRQISKINLTLDQIKRGLDDYMYKKRFMFPRYYLLTD